VVNFATIGVTGRSRNERTRQRRPSRR
jgi:hypothetical protein